jgi:hypothetical protein
VPLNATLAGAVTVAEVTVKMPVAAPMAVGVKITPTVQLAPPARLLGQLFCVKLNGAATVSVSELAAVLPELETVTICVALDWPVNTSAKVNCDGFTFSPAAAVPAPFNGT